MARGLHQDKPDCGDAFPSPRTEFQKTSGFQTSSVGARAIVRGHSLNAVARFPDTRVVIANNVLHFIVNG